MLHKFQYDSETERNIIIASNSDKWLVEEQNIVEGNFLIFTDVKPSLSEIEEIKQRVDLTEEAIDFLLMTGGMM